MSKNKELEMSPEDLSLLIEQNTFLQHALRIMNKLPLDPDKAEEVNGGPINYLDLWDKVSLNKKTEVGAKPTSDAIAFYFQLLSTGYDNFGTQFFINMIESENTSYFLYAVKCFIDYMTGEVKNEENQ